MIRNPLETFVYSKKMNTLLKIGKKNQITYTKFDPQHNKFLNFKALRYVNAN